MTNPKKIDPNDWNDDDFYPIPKLNDTPHPAPIISTSPDSPQTPSESFDWDLPWNDSDLDASGESFASKSRPHTPEMARPLQAVTATTQIFPKGVPAEHFPAFATRSALFATSRHALAAVAATVASMPHYKITRSGPGLDMRDKAVWEAAVEAGRRHKNLGSEFRLSLTSVMRRAGSAQRGKTTLDGVFESLLRLTEVTVSFHMLKTDMGGRGKLLLSARRDADGSALVSLDPNFIIPAFEEDWLLLSRPARRAKFRTGVGRWMHDYLSASNEQANGFELADLRAWSGYEPLINRFSGLVAKAALVLADPACLGEPPGGGPIKSFVIEKPTRDTASWVVKVARGSERVVFSMPSAERARRSAVKDETRAASQPPQKSKKDWATARNDALAAKRRGPAL